MSDNLREIYGPGESSVAIAARAARERAEAAAGVAEGIASGLPAAIAEGVAEEVPGAVAGAITTQVGPAVATAVGQQAPPAVATAVGAQVPPAVEAAVESQVPTAVAAEVGSLAPTVVAGQVASQVPPAVAAQVSSQVDPKVTQAAGSASDAAGSAASALASKDSAASIVTNAGVYKQTLVALQAVTSPADTRGVVSADGTNNGTYRSTGAGWVRTSTETPESLAAMLARRGKHDTGTLIPIIMGGLRGAAIRFYHLWTYPASDPDAGKTDLNPSARLIAKIVAGVQGQISGALAVTAKFISTPPKHGPYFPFGILIRNTGGTPWYSAWLYPNGPDKGLLDFIPAQAWWRRIAMGPSVPTADFTAVSAVPSRRLLKSSDEGWAEIYTERQDLAAPYVRLPANAGRAKGISWKGQSNTARGGGGAPVITTPPAKRRLLMPNGGPLFSLDGVWPASSITNLTPAMEVISETPVTASMRMLHALQLAKGIRPSVRIGESHGVGARRLSQIAKGTDIYANGQMLRSKIAELALDEGLPGVWYPGYGMIQGEAERQVSTARSAYVATGVTAQADEEADIRALTRQPEPVWWVLQQTAGVSGIGPTGAGGALGSYSGLAQHDLMLTAPRTTLSCPPYWMNDPYGFVAANEVHYSSLGHDVNGEQIGIALWRIEQKIEEAVAKGIDPWTLTIADIKTVLRPNLAAKSVVGNVFTVPLILPDGATDVTLDTTTLPNPGNYGFRKTAGTAGALTAVRLVGTAGNRALELEVASPGTATFTYANEVMDNTTVKRSCAWGNIRTTTGTASIAVSGVTLWDWLAIHDVTFP